MMPRRLRELSGSTAELREDPHHGVFFCPGRQLHKEAARVCFFPILVRTGSFLSKLHTVFMFTEFDFI